MGQDVLKQVMATAQTWLDGNYDAETKAQVRAMMEADDKTELINSLPHFGIWHRRFAWHHGSRLQSHK